jgi:hypothetical protein
MPSRSNRPPGASLRVGSQTSTWRNVGNGRPFDLDTCQLR